MQTVHIAATHELRFADGSPVRAASALTPLSDRWLIAQDDATHAALWRHGRAESLRLFAPVDGADHFSEDSGNKHLKPDLEAACTVHIDGSQAALLLGSGSLPARMRAVLVRHAAGGDPTVREADLTPLYHRVAAALDLPTGVLNLEGACPVGHRLRWFQRGHAGGLPSASVDIDLTALVAAVRGYADPSDVEVDGPVSYDLGEADGVPLAITDAVALPDGRIAVSAAAEDAPDAVADGPIVGAALAVLDGPRPVALRWVPPAPGGEVWKMEGLALLSQQGPELALLAVVDQDDPAQPSFALTLSARVT